MRALIETKLKHGDAVETEKTRAPDDDDGEGGEVLDLMEALRRSGEASRDRAKPTPKAKQSRSAF
ncbi:hypothetical protein [Cryobacterium sp. Y11]|jgi:DNA end-binding protein Ku|uniref:hypothetical protein n=1 Tax=Cryobacterium sp. Y11 TaxID=2045016 RepID=UPI000CE54350|nr:hypothetical protein [Cryobacterium sp. Y11]